MKTLIAEDAEKHREEASALSFSVFFCAHCG
jgi:hypothetical protein